MASALSLRPSSLPISREVEEEKKSEEVKTASTQPHVLTKEERVAKIAEMINGSPGRHASIIDGNIKIYDGALCLYTTLADFQATEGDLRKKFIQYFQLQQGIDELTKIFPFYERLAKVSSAVLEQVPILSLQCDDTPTKAKNSVIVEALMEEEKLIATSVKDLANRPYLNMFAVKVHHMLKERPDLLIRLSQTPFAKPYYWESLQLPAAKLPLMPAQEIMEIRSKLPAEAFRLLTPEQVQLLDFSKLSPRQIVACIQGPIKDKASIERRFSLLSDQQLSVVFKDVNGSVLRFFPLESLSAVPVADMSKEQIENLFCYFTLRDEEQKKRIATLSPNAINSILPKLGEDFLLYLSDEQIRGLDYSKVKTEQIGAIFDRWVLTDEEKSRRIALVPPQSIDSAAKVATEEFLKRLTLEQVRALNGRSLDIDRIVNIFSRIPEEQKKAKIGVLSVESIERICQKGFPQVLDYVSDEQLSKINLRNVPQDSVDVVFPPLDPGKWHPGHTYSVETTRSGNEKHHTWETNRKGDSGGIIENEEWFQRELAEKKAKCLKNFGIIPREQFAAIKGKISPEAVAFLTQR